MRCVLLNCDMNILIASIGGPGALWILTTCIAILSGSLALGALLPAALGHLRSAVLVTALASIAGLFTTVLLGYSLFISSDGTGHFGNFVREWTILAGLSLAVSLFAVLLAWLRGRAKERLKNDIA